MHRPNPVQTVVLAQLALACVLATTLGPFAVAQQVTATRDVFYRGNGHMLMLEMNHLEIAATSQRWLASHAK